VTNNAAILCFINSHEMAKRSAAQRNETKKKNGNTNNCHNSKFASCNCSIFASYLHKSPPVRLSVSCLLSRGFRSRISASPHLRISAHCHTNHNFVATPSGGIGAVLAFKSRASYCGWRWRCSRFLYRKHSITTWSSGCIKLEYRLRSWS